MTLKTIKKRVVVKVDKRPTDIEVGGIYLPQGSDVETKTGIVESCGDACKDVHPGERVLIGQFAGHEVTSTEGIYIVLGEDDILAVLE